MHLLVGLGNPGPAYADTRHNVGFLVVDELARRMGTVLDVERFHGRFGRGRLAGADCALLQPTTFMNRSGRAVAAAVAGLAEVEPTRDLLVVQDDLDLPLGRLRLRAAGGAGGHNGLADVLEALGTRAVPRLRVGIGRPVAGAIDHVLAGFEPAEREELVATIGRAADAVERWIRDGIERAMEQANRPPGSEASGSDG